MKRKDSTEGSRGDLILMMDSKGIQKGILIIYILIFSWCFFLSGLSIYIINHPFSKKCQKTRHKNNKNEHTHTQKKNIATGLFATRYRTLPREALWEKALQGPSSALQRREKRLGPAAAHSISGFARQSGGRPSSKGQRTRSPEAWY